MPSTISIGRARLRDSITTPLRKESGNVSISSIYRIGDKRCDLDLPPFSGPLEVRVSDRIDPTPKSVPVRGLGFGVPKPPVASPWRTP